MGRLGRRAVAGPLSTESFAVPGLLGLLLLIPFTLQQTLNGLQLRGRGELLVPENSEDGVSEVPQVSELMLEPTQQWIGHAASPPFLRTAWPEAKGHLCKKRGGLIGVKKPLVDHPRLDDPAQQLRAECPPIPNSTVRRGHWGRRGAIGMRARERPTAAFAGSAARHMMGRLQRDSGRTGFPKPPAQGRVTPCGRFSQRTASAPG